MCFGVNKNDRRIKCLLISLHNNSICKYFKIAFHVIFHFSLYIISILKEEYLAFMLLSTCKKLLTLFCFEKYLYIL